jgi:hypothetical protein
MLLIFYISNLVYHFLCRAILASWEKIFFIYCC